MQVQELKQLKELLEIASVVQGIITNKEAQVITTKTVSKPSRSDKYLNGFSDSAVRVFNAFKKKHQFRNKNQKNQEWKLLSEVAPNVDVKTIRANYDKQNKQNPFIGLTKETKTAGSRGGLLIEINHLNQKGNTEIRLIDSVYNKDGKQVAFYEYSKQE